MYRVEDTRLGRTLAVKVFARGNTQDQERLSRFVREARTASSLNRASMAHIYEIGQSDRLHFIAMEYAKGQSVAQKMSGKPCGKSWMSAFKRPTPWRKRTEKG